MQKEKKSKKEKKEKKEAGDASEEPTTSRKRPRENEENFHFDAADLMALDMGGGEDKEKQYGDASAMDAITLHEERVPCRIRITMMAGKITQASVAKWAPGCEGTRKDLLARSAAGGGEEAQRRVRIRLSKPKEKEKKEEDGPIRMTSEVTDGQLMIRLTTRNWEKDRLQDDTEFDDQGRALFVEAYCPSMPAPFDNGPHPGRVVESAALGAVMAPPLELRDCKLPTVCSSLIIARL